MLKNIVFEDEHLIVVYKPAGIATQTARLGQQDMVSELKNHLAGKDGREKSVPYLGVVHRLDQPVSGLLVFARDRQTAAGLSRQIACGRMKKCYYAVVIGRPPKAQGRLEDYLYREAGTNRSVAVSKGYPGAKQAVLEYTLVKTLMALDEAVEQEVSLLEITLITGRHHQIRVQMASSGMPLLGDGKYGTPASREFSMRAGCRNVALCAFRLEFDHPVTKERLSFERQPEGEIFLPFFEQ